MTLILFRTRKQLDRMARKDALHETRHRGQVLAKYALITTQRELSIKLIQLLVALRDKELPFITQRTHLDGESIPSGDYLWARTYDENDDINAKHRYLYKIFIPRYDMKNLWIQVWTDENNTVLFSGSHFRPFDEKNNYAKALYHHSLFGKPSIERKEMQDLKNNTLHHPVSNKIWPKEWMDVLQYLEQQVNTPVK